MLPRHKEKDKYMHCTSKIKKKKDVCVCVCVCIDLIDMIEGVTKSGSVTVHIAPRGRFFIMMFTSFEFSALVER